MVSEIIQKLRKPRPRLEGCPEYPRFQKVFSESLLDCFEEQLDQYIRMQEVSEAYLRDVPRIVCWYEGMIPTEDLLGNSDAARHAAKAVINGMKVLSDV